MSQLGVIPGDTVGVFGGNSVWHFVTMWACLRLGAIWAPINSGLVAVDLNYIISDLGPRLMFVEPDLLDGYLLQRPSNCETVVIADEWKGNLPVIAELVERSSQHDEPRYAWGPGDLAFIMYSGGTTGLPKGIELPAAFPILAAAKYDEAIDLKDTDLVYSCSQLYHSWLPTTVLTACLFADASCVVARRFSASRFLEEVRSHGATVIDPFGPMISMILSRTPRQSDDADNPARKLLGPMGGMNFTALERRREFETRFGVETFDMYGLTETGSLVTRESPGRKKWGSSGAPGDWYEVAILDENDNALPAGEIGEIAVRPTLPNQMALGYRNQGGKTLRTWRNLWIHTGDRGYLDDEGYLFFAGRQAFWARRRGENISLLEIESVIDSHPSVLESTVLGVPSNLGDDELRAYVVAKESLTEADIRSWCADRVAAFKVPGDFFFIDHLPRSATKQEVERAKLLALSRVQRPMSVAEASDEVQVVREASQKDKL
jgi:crotonobetaine/carnitine-CoA ligase